MIIVPYILLNKCIEEISKWMCHNFLCLKKNQTKVRLIVFGPKEQRLKVSAHLETMTLKPTNQAREPGQFNSHIETITKSTYHHQDIEKLVQAFIFIRLDYCNGVFTGLTTKK